MLCFNRVLALVAGAALALLGLTQQAIAEGSRQGHADHGLRSSLIPEYPDVIGEYIHIGGARTAGTPEVLDTASFLRVRSRLDRLQPKDADAVVIAMPGFSSIPAHWLYLAAQLVHKGNERTCDNDKRKGGRHAHGERCSIEVWVIDRRGSNLEDTAGLLRARRDKDPGIALDYYFGRSILSLDPARPGRFPATPPHLLPQQPDATFRPLEQADVPFMAEWGFEAHAGDVDSMIALVEQHHGARNIFLAGHSQGGGFISAWAGRRAPDGRRGFEKLAGLIALDPAALHPVLPASPSAAQLGSYFTGVNALRTGAAPVFTNGTGALPNYNGPRAGARTSIFGVSLAFEGFGAENKIFPARQIGSLPFSPAGDSFLLNARFTNLAVTGLGLDTDPVPNGFLQNTIIIQLGEGLGRLGFTPAPGTETLCDRSNPRSPPTACIPSAAQIDPTKVYGWIEGGGKGGVTNEVGRARLFGNSLLYAPSRTNVRPVAVDFAVSGRRTIYAGDMNAANWYPSNRYDSDMAFLGAFSQIEIQQQGVSLDIDKSAIDIPVFMARQSPAAAANNPLPQATDYTEITRLGTFQTPAAAAITPFSPAISAGFYKHTDFVSADDSLAGQVTPGQPGVSAVSNTVVDWMLARAQGRAKVPSPRDLGVRAVR